MGAVVITPRVGRFAGGTQVVLRAVPGGAFTRSVLDAAT